MKKTKNFFFAGLAIVALAAGGFARSKANQPDQSLSKLQLETIEALTEGVELNGPCNNTSGYRKWDVNRVGPTPKARFRDCCYEEKSGYNPVGCTQQ
ncbi:MAG: hypothetical protein K2M27_06350 [Muribaculaceae bacterium]|nr:hypothetical protein [Muribaculaceae bacterium]MDE6533135.1 hypothetical protein [Muribaculaceae bacterium]